MTTRQARAFPARYAGTCVECGGAVAVGDRVRWERGRGVWHARTDECGQDDYSFPCGCSDYHYADCPTRGGVYA